MAWIPFSQVISAMQTSLASAADAATGFAVSELKVELPAEVLTLGGQVVVQLPGQIDNFDPAKLSKLTFTLGATAAPEAKGPPSPWSKVYTGTQESLYGVAVSGARVLVAGRQGTVLESKDSGATFLPLSLGTSERLHAVALSDAGYALAVGNNGAVFRQPTEGEAWSEIALGVTSCLNGVAAWGDIAVIAGANGQIFLSIDGGQVWKAVQLGNNNLHAVWGAGPESVLVAGAKGELWLCDFTAFNFIPVQSGVGKDLFGVWGAGPHQLYAVGQSGTILGSTDGKVWNKLPSGTTENLYCVMGTGPGKILVAGRNGTVLRSSDGASFSPLSPGVGEALHAIASTGTGAFLLTGVNGLILAYRPSMDQCVC